MLNIYMILKINMIRQPFCLKKKTAIRPVAVRETSVTRHHGGLIGDSPETPQHYPSLKQHYRTEEFKGIL